VIFYSVLLQNLCRRVQHLNRRSTDDVKAHWGATSCFLQNTFEGQAQSSSYHVYDEANEDKYDV